MIVFAALLALSAVYEGLYLRHSARRGRLSGALGAGLAALLCIAAAGLLIWYRD